MAIIDPIILAQQLIRCPSVTPKDAGALDALQQALESLGFRCYRLPFGDKGRPQIDNLYARWGRSAPNLCFAGHTDVVPEGDASAWSLDPFAGEIRDGFLWGRGAADMKAAIACFVAAASRFLEHRTDQFIGSLSLLITGDEEGNAIDGTVKVLDWLRQQKEHLDHCIVGEPTNPLHLGEMIKIGRRGSMTGHLVVHGTQGHTAYPHLADNPCHHLIAMLDAITRNPLDQATAHFQASTLQISTIDVGNPASNVIPETARATFNIRFNDRHTSANLEQWLREIFRKAAAPKARWELTVHVSGESFLTPPGHLSEILSQAVNQRLGMIPELSTTGGTSDARFIKDYCPVAEFGLVGQTMHKIDERCSLEDIAALTDIYTLTIERYFA
ncbi:MAG: succinyl-diaminopimelate desuccinylase [Alphaproteobacteria bacterium]